MSIYESILKQKRSGKKMLGVLIDPDATDKNDIKSIVDNSINAHADFILIGGSHILSDLTESIIEEIKTKGDIPCIQFPNATAKVETKLDGILLLSLISGRNPDLLIGRHVENAAIIKKSQLEVLSTGYILIDGGRVTSVEYMSNTRAIPRDKYSIISSTAMAGELLGLKLIYLEAGSGAKYPVPVEAIKAVASQISIPMIVGGGIRTVSQAQAILASGADAIIIGTAFEDDPSFIYDMSTIVHSFNTTIHHD